MLLFEYHFGHLVHSAFAKVGKTDQGMSIRMHTHKCTHYNCLQNSSNNIKTKQNNGQKVYSDGDSVVTNYCLMH